MDRKLPAALLIAVGVQAAAVMFWTGRAAARIEAVEQRVAAQAPVVERLARLEAQVEGTRTAVTRVEALLDRRFGGE